MIPPRNSTLALALLLAAGCSADKAATPAVRQATHAVKHAWLAPHVSRRVIED